MRVLVIALLGGFWLIKWVVEGLTDESIIASQIKGAIDKGKKLLVKFGFYIPLFSLFLK